MCLEGLDDLAGLAMEKGDVGKATQCSDLRAKLVLASQDKPPADPAPLTGIVRATIVKARKLTASDIRAENYVPATAEAGEPEQPSGGDTRDGNDKGDTGDDE